MPHFTAGGVEVRRLAQMLLAWVFIHGGVDVLRKPEPRVTAAQETLDKLTALRMLPDDPLLLVRANAAAQVAGGVMLAADVLPRVAALGLAASLVPTTVGGHAFWRQTDPQARATHRIQFNKNVALVGGLLAVAVRPSRKRRRRPKRRS
jgi:putative oxidoreductase